MWISTIKKTISGVKCPLTYAMTIVHQHDLDHKISRLNMNNDIIPVPITDIDRIPAQNYLVGDYRLVCISTFDLRSGIKTTIARSNLDAGITPE